MSEDVSTWDFIPIRNWNGSAAERCNDTDFNRIAHNIAVVWYAFEVRGYLGAMREMKYDWNHMTDLSVTFAQFWTNMRLNLWDIYSTFPFSQIFPLAPVYTLSGAPSASQPVEPLDYILLNKMEINLLNMYNFILALEVYPLNILLTKDIARRKLARGIQF